MFHFPTIYLGSGWCFSLVFVFCFFVCLASWKSFLLDFISVCLFVFYNYFVLFCFVFCFQKFHPPWYQMSKKYGTCSLAAIYPAVYLFPCRLSSFPYRLLPNSLSTSLPIPCRRLPFPCRLSPFPCQLLPFLSCRRLPFLCRFLPFPWKHLPIPCRLLPFTCHLNVFFLPYFPLFFCERDNFVLVLCNILQGRKKINREITKSIRVFSFSCDLILLHVAVSRERHKVNIIACGHEKDFHV